MTAAILAGGRSSRMGKDKAFLELGDRYVIEHVLSRLRSVFREVFIVTRQPDDHLRFNAAIIEDKSPKQCAISGIYTAVKNCGKKVFITGCDMPFLNGDVIRDMCAVREDFDAIVPKNGKTGWEPLHAIYSISCLPHIEAQLEKDDLSLRALLERMKTRAYDQKNALKFEYGMMSFFNINTPEDLEKARGIAISRKVF